MDSRLTISNQPVGVFDSGLGGISVLKELHKLMPNEEYIFYGDSANAPYGIKTAKQVYDLSKKIVEMFINHYHVKAIVIACNTATSAAASKLRQEYSIPIIGLEPAIKPAIEENPNGKILAMATPLTLAGKKFDDTVRKYQTDSEIIKVPAPKLVEFVEKGELDSKNVINYLHEILDNNLPTDAVVLGCTHFPFVKATIKKVVGDNVKFYDGGQGAAKYLQQQLFSNNLLNTSNHHAGKITFYNSNPDPSEIKLSKALYNLK